MGLLDRFRGGSDDTEDELEENIEKIREKIQGQGGGQRDLSRPPAPDREGGDRAPRPPAPAGEERGQAPEPPESGEQERPSRGQLGAQEGADRQEAQPQERGQRPAGPDRSDDRAPGGGRAAPRRGQDRPGSDRPSPDRPRQGADRQDTGPQEREGGGAPDSTELPEPPEVKELDISEVEGGSLYVTVDTFRDTLQTVADLRTLARDLDDHVGSMEGTLDEDRETARGVEQLLDSADDRIEEMRDLMTE